MKCINKFRAKIFNALSHRLRLQIRGFSAQEKIDREIGITGLCPSEEALREAGV